MLVCRDSILAFLPRRLTGTSLKVKTMHTSVFITWARQRFFCSPLDPILLHIFRRCMYCYMWRFICIIESKLDDVTNRRMCAVPTNGRFRRKLSFSAELLISFQQIWADIFVSFPSFYLVTSFEPNRLNVDSSVVFAIL